MNEFVVGVSSFVWYYFINSVQYYDSAVFLFLFVNCVCLTNATSKT